MTLLLQPSCYLIIQQKARGYPIIDLLFIVCTYIARETSNYVIVHPHIEIALFISTTLTNFVFPFSYQQ